MHDLNEIIEKIKEHTNLNKNEIIEKINEKKRELSNLISDEGAAYIIAKDLGIDLIKKRSYELKIKNIISGMRNINVIGRVLNIDDVREFKTERNGQIVEGRLRSFEIGDDTGTIRVVLWNNEIEKIDGIQSGDIIKINNGYTKDNFGQPEIRLGNGSIEQVADVKKIPSVEEIMRIKTLGTIMTYNQSDIADLREGDIARIRACIVQIFDINPFFFICPDCGMKVKDICEVHKKGEPNMVISGVADDGTGNMRIVLFRKNAEKLIGMSTEEALKLSKETKIIDKVKLGKDFIFKGYVKMNKLFDKLEFVVNEIEDVDIKEEIKKMIT